MYKTTAQQRKRALAYYYANRAAAQAAQLVWRRAQGVRARKQPMTEQEKLARTIMCKTCGRQVTAPSRVRSGAKVCTRCSAKKYPTGKSALAWRKRHLAKVRKEKLRRGCERCGYKPRDAKKLDFHHRDPATKLFRIGRAGRFSGPKVWAEIVKCDVLCKVCHEAAH